MKEQKRNIDELFLEELGNATEVPPSSVWTTLETQLDGPGSPGATGNLGRFKTWWLVWSLVVLVSGSVTGYMVLNKPKRDALKTIPGKELPDPVPARSNKGVADTSGNAIPGSDNDSNHTQEGYDDRQDIKHDRTDGDAGAKGSQEANKDIRSGIDKQSHESHTLKTGHTAVRGGGAATSSLSSNVATASGHKRGVSGPAVGAIKTSGITDRMRPSANRTTGNVPANLDTDTRGEHDVNRKQVNAAASITSAGNTAGKSNSRSSAAGIATGAGKGHPGGHAVVTKTASPAEAHAEGSNSSGSSTTGKKTNKSPGDPGSGKRGRNIGSTSSRQTAPVAKSTPAATNPANHNAVVKSKNATVRPAGQSLEEPAASGAGGIATGTIAMTRKPAAAKTGGMKNGGHAAENNTPVGKLLTDAVSAAKGSAGKPVLPVPAIEQKQAPAVATGQHESSKAAGSLQVGARDNNTLLIDTEKMNSEDDGTDEPYLPAVAAPRPALSKMNVTEDQPGRPGVAPVSRPVATVVQQAAAQQAVTAPKLRSDVPDFLKVSQQGGTGGGSGDGDAASAKKTKKKGPRRSDFEGGVKFGYEVGAAAFTSGKFVASFYAQYNLDERLGLVIQPAIKIATTNRKLETPQGNYYSVTRPTEVVRYSIDTPMGSPISSFAYSQTYDSMIASVVSQQKYAEIDLPLLLRYQLSKNFSIMGGINITLGKIINLNSSVKTISGLMLRDTILNVPDTMAPAPASKFDHRSSVPFSSYAAAEGLNAENNPVRFGYTLSMSYVLKDRIMIDFLMQQTTSNLNYIPNREIRKLYSQPYMRFTVGYKLFGGRKQVRDK